MHTTGYPHYAFPFDASARGNDYAPREDEPFAYLHAHASGQVRISTDSSLAFALGNSSTTHVPYSATYGSQTSNIPFNTTETFAGTNDQSMCLDDETMSCVVYGDEERGGYDSPYCGTLSPMSSADYPDAGYWDNPPDTGYFDNPFEHPTPPNASLRSSFPPSRSYTLESAIIPVAPAAPARKSSSSSIVSLPAPIGTASPSSHDRSVHAPSSTAPGKGATRTRPSLAPVKTDFDQRDAKADFKRSSTSPLSANSIVPESAPAPLSLAALASQLDGSGMDEIPVSESEAKLGQAMFKLHSAVPPPKEQPPKKKPIMACLFCRERKICCGPPPPESSVQTCKQCTRRGLDCVFPTESRRGQHKRSPRAARVAALADAHLHKLAQSQHLQVPSSPSQQDFPQPQPPIVKKRKHSKPRVLKSKTDVKASSPLVDDSAGDRDRS